MFGKLVPVPSGSMVPDRDLGKTHILECINQGITFGGLKAVENGQMEAGRSLGLSYGQVMLRIIMPQAAKISLPTLINELIALVKETAVAGYIALGDLTRGGDQIQVGDNVIVVTLEHGLHDLRDIVEN